MSMEIYVTVAPVIISVEGTTSKERKMSVIERGVSNSALLALISAKGDVGKHARQASAGIGLSNIAKAACNCNYRPLAEYLCLQLGEGVVISNRSGFESLPDMFEMRIMKIKSAKNGGYREDKNGAQAPTAQHALMAQLKAECSAVIEAVATHKAAQAIAKAQQEAAATAAIAA